MKYKLKSGMEVELHEDDIKAIAEMHDESFDFEEMEDYFKSLHMHSVSKMEHISGKVITDEESIDMALHHVMRYGTYHDFIKMLRYYMDWDLSYHLLESTKWMKYKGE